MIAMKYLLLLNLLPILFQAIPAASMSVYNFTIAKPNCIDQCGGVRIPFPFGITQECYKSDSFKVVCNESFNPPKPFLRNSTQQREILDISLNGQARITKRIAKNCYAPDGRIIINDMPTFNLADLLTVNNTANKFTIVGCDSYGYISGEGLRDKYYSTGCIATCRKLDDMPDGFCVGIGCCQVASIPDEVWKMDMELGSFNNHTQVMDFNNCSYAFFVEESSFTFSPENLTNLRNVERLPMVIDWAIGNGTCNSASRSSSYACTSPNTECYMPDRGDGYRCRCKTGYQGNPYLNSGCQDINECENPLLHNCTKHCINTEGGFKCHCPKRYRGHGIGSEGCTHDETLVLRCVAGVAVGLVVLLITAWWMYIVFKRRKAEKTKQKNFLRNGGKSLQEKLKRQGSADVAKIFTSAELKRATNNFHKDMIVGQGGYGTVYKGLLANDTTVAIKVSKEIDPSQIEQFINEIVVLSQINHRHVVKLLGCCLETQVPLLVYEFVSNSTLFEHIHNQAKKRSLHWNLRLKIAMEIAGVLSYLHSEASIPIIHRDVKCTNILLDNDFSAKVSDFGASRLVPTDETRVSTVVQGTLGYLDPEYMQSSQLTEKSDVYSFGVVLIELLTGIKAFRYDVPEEERNLANHFLSRLKRGRLSEVLDQAIVSDANREQLTQVSNLAQACLHVRGEDRPSMKEVAMELESLRLAPGKKHSWSNRIEQEAEEIEASYGTAFVGLVKVDSYSLTSTSTAYDSTSDHAELSSGISKSSNAGTSE